MEVVLFGVADATRMRAALSIRHVVFVEEQGVPRDDEIDAHDLSDGDAVHALAYGVDGATPIGTGRFYAAEPHTAQIGRMAVLAAFRNGGVGRVLLTALVNEAQERGFYSARLLAQVHAVRFYERAGFRTVADEADVWDAGILHRVMDRALA